MPKTIEIGEAKTIEDSEHDLTIITHLSGNVVAQARLAKRLMAKHKSQPEVARLMGIKQPWVSRLLKLLVLPDSVLDEVESGDLSAQTAYLLTRLPEKERARLIQRLDGDDGKLTQDDVRAAVRRTVVTDDLLDLVEAPTPRGGHCPTCGRKY